MDVSAWLLAGEVGVTHVDKMLSRESLVDGLLARSRRVLTEATGVQTLVSIGVDVARKG